jgi:hypothetical protein
VPTYCWQICSALLPGSKNSHEPTTVPLSPQALYPELAEPLDDVPVEAPLPVEALPDAPSPVEALPDAPPAPDAPPVEAPAVPVPDDGLTPDEAPVVGAPEDAPVDPPVAPAPDEARPAVAAPDDVPVEGIVPAELPVPPAVPVPEAPDGDPELEPPPLPHPHKASAIKTRLNVIEKRGPFKRRLRPLLSALANGAIWCSFSSLSKQHPC